MSLTERIQCGLIRTNTDTYPVYRGLNTIGCSKTATVSVNNVSVSTQHAIITVINDEQHYIGDVQSSNGTTLSTGQLEPFSLYELLDGACIVFGDVAGTYSKLVTNADISFPDLEALADAYLDDERVRDMQESQDSLDLLVGLPRLNSTELNMYSFNDTLFEEVLSHLQIDDAIEQPQAEEVEDDIFDVATQQQLTVPGSPISKNEKTGTKAENIQRHKVAFTMLTSARLKSYVRKLGGSVVDCIDACTVLVTSSVQRTPKLLEAVARAKPICSPGWIQESKQSSHFLDPLDYILHDPEAEHKWNFKLSESLQRASQSRLLQGYFVRDALKSAVECCGGKCVNRAPTNCPQDKFLIVANADQKSTYSAVLRKSPGLVVQPEAIFDGVLRQELRLDRHLL